MHRMYSVGSSALPLTPQVAAGGVFVSGARGLIGPAEAIPGVPLFEIWRAFLLTRRGWPSGWVSAGLGRRSLHLAELRLPIASIPEWATPAAARWPLHPVLDHAMCA